MANHLNSDQQLDQAVKEALDSYEVPFESSAWAEMEKSLDAAPKSFHPFKKWSFSLNTIIGIAALAGGLLIFKYSISGADNTSNQAEITAPVEQKTKPAPAPVQPKPETAMTVTDTAAAPTAEETTAQTPVQKPSQLANLSTASPERTKKKKKDNASSTEAPVETSEIDFMKMTESKNNTPAFGDQIDPVKGFIHSTSESDKMKKLAESKLFGDNAIKTDTTFSTKRTTAPTETDSNSTSEKKRKRDREKKKRDSKKDTIPSGTTTRSNDKSSDEDNVTAEKNSDTSKVRKNPKQQPKYKGERTIIDP
jgi:hypothetical protein